jgi:hypothetical protein
LSSADAMPVLSGATLWTAAWLSAMTPRPKPTGRISSAGARCCQ